jgi:hypothetical protein
MENEVKPPSTVSPSVGAAIAKGRQDKKDAEGKSMSQKDLATKINEKPSVVSGCSPLPCRLSIVLFRAICRVELELTSHTSLLLLFSQPCSPSTRSPTTKPAEPSPTSLCSPRSNVPSVSSCVGIPS